MSSIEDKLALANSNVPKTYMAGKSCKDLTDFSHFCYLGARLDMLEYLNTCSGTNFASMFEDCEKISTIPQLDTANGTRFKRMFFYCISLTSIPQLNTSNGTNFEEMFYGCEKLTTVPQLNTSKVTTFNSMFQNCRSLTTIPKLDTSKGTNFRSMLSECSALTSIPQLDISKGTNIDYMFYNCRALVSIPQLDISKGAYKGHSLMFRGCSSLKNISFTGTIGATISFSDSPLLTTDSLHSIVYALADKTGSTTRPTLTLNSASWEALEETTPPTGSSSWHEYITNVKGWIYA